MESKKTVTGQRLEVLNREEVIITGVEHVDSFDEQVISLKTNLGNLILKGEGLNITQLNMEEGKLVVQGYLYSLTYAETKGGKSKGIFDKLLK
ncbi:MAG: sporulation protein YabP [Bacillota bacterium]|uniref:Sporulation protein YabP n=2 Tax=Carboxydocella TaxID=178898 RepID=A0A1T4SF07_9FIRM|nr:MULTISPECIES: sporulation protein YabP [Carboxydocella]AVX19291.1 sporulation protein YabP [Carboxydocella thermautotrophica]AVX29706.1 sporulation protein YabP [Carboxydocella thermautotrophica]SKA26736.1 sporulation protein YabP [Carboxydocella sporoproducens DSM 16521]GAW27463.1 hypothetical protein ULO1_00330 [Carboxydocella sp. ULO1]GAW30362.1 hypothetical protein JDF658_01270 [Carboxydocella sp. JDF658]